MVGYQKGKSIIADYCYSVIVMSTDYFKARQGLSPTATVK